MTATAKDFAGFYRGKQYHEPDFDCVLDRATAAGVEKVLLTGMSLSDVDFNLRIAQSRPQQCSITVGVHPYHASEPETDAVYFDKLFEHVDNLSKQRPSPIAAFGELGLDYDHLEWASKEVQIRTFKTQLDRFVERKYDLPLFLHCRAAFDDFVEAITPYLDRIPRKGVVHSFVGSKPQMQRLIDMGFDISVNGFSFRDRESMDMVAAIPLERLHIETDAPWGVIQPSLEVAKRYWMHARPLPQAKKRDKFEKGLMVKDRNESCAIERVALIVAGLMGASVEEIADNVWKNSVRMFWSV